MKLHTVAFFVYLTIEVVSGGLIGHDERATSYQNIHIEHFHPVPTYIKKEHKELLEHPVSIGQTSSKVEVHHGDKHDHGYAFQNLENNLHGYEGGFSGLEGHQEESAGYQVHDQVEELSPIGGHLGEEELSAHYQSEGGESYHQY